MAGERRSLYHGNQGLLPRPLCERRRVILPQVGSRKIESSPKTLKDAVIGGNEQRLYVSENHYRNFLDCVKSRKDGVEPVETGHRTSMLCHLGNIAMQLKRRIKFDPAREQIVGDAEAAAMLSRPLRGPWKY